MPFYSGTARECAMRNSELTPLDGSGGWRTGQNDPGWRGLWTYGLSQATCLPTVAHLPSWDRTDIESVVSD